MVLVDKSIRQRLALVKEDSSRLVIRPFVDYGECPEGAISYGVTSAGYDLRVGYKFMIFRGRANPNGMGSMAVDPKKFDPRGFELFDLTEQGPGATIEIPGNCFALAETVEYVEIPKDRIAIVLGKSTYARCGLNLNMTPLEPGWRGVVTVELLNGSPTPVVVHAGEGIGQMLLLGLDDVPQFTYDTKPRKKYQDQDGLTPPRGAALAG